MPYIKGGTLRDRLGGSKALDRSEILSICTQVAKGLMYAHARGLIHRDLKPDNLLIDDREQAYITDFGLVRSFMDNSMLDVSQLTAEGTPAYMSPGVAAGHMEDTRCDIYAFGAMMYEMLTGKLPYNGPDVDSILEAIRCGPPPAIQKINPSADKHLISIAETAMARELRARYATMEDILQDLERVARGQAPNGSHGHSLRRNASPAMKILIPILTILLLVFVLLHFQHDSKQPRSPIEQPTQ
jgi:serine/threonine protein kinase